MAEEMKKLKIIPAIEEQPPLDIRTEGDDRYDYKMRREKKISKGLLRGKLGRLVVQSAQPQSLKLPYFRGPDADSIPNTMATMNVRFDPIEESSLPPDLKTLKARLKVATGFATVPMDEIPTKSSQFYNSNFRGIFVDTRSLPSRPLSNIEWQKHTSSKSLDSQDSEIPNPSKAYKGGCFYTCNVRVPISLSMGNKVFVPSFDSCLVSRIYSLDLYLSFNTPSYTPIDPKFQLKLPIQVSSEGNPDTETTDFAEVWFDPCYDRLPSGF